MCVCAHVYKAGWAHHARRGSSRRHSGTAPTPRPPFRSCPDTADSCHSPTICTSPPDNLRTVASRRRYKPTIPDHTRRRTIYIRQIDVTESMVTIRSSHFVSTELGIMCGVKRVKIYHVIQIKFKKFGVKKMST